METIRTVGDAIDYAEKTIEALRLKSEELDVTARPAFEAKAAPIIRDLSKMVPDPDLRARYGRDLDRTLPARGRGCPPHRGLVVRTGRRSGRPESLCGESRAGRRRDRRPDRGRGHDQLRPGAGLGRARHGRDACEGRDRSRAGQRRRPGRGPRKGRYLHGRAHGACKGARSGGRAGARPRTSCSLLTRTTEDPIPICRISPICCGMAT